MMEMRMISSKVLRKVKKNDLIKMTTEYSREQNYIVESNSYKKEIIRVIPLNIEDHKQETTISLSFGWEMIEEISMVSKEFILFFLNHSSTKINDKIKTILS